MLGFRIFGVRIEGCCRRSKFPNAVTRLQLFEHSMGVHLPGLQPDPKLQWPQMLCFTVFVGAANAARCILHSGQEPLKLFFPSCRILKTPNAARYSIADFQKAQML